MPRRVDVVTVTGMAALLPVPEHHDPAAVRVDPAAIAALQATLDATRADAAAHAARHAATDAALLALCGVADIDAAQQCMCSCHPRVAQLHDGGRTCSCQLSPVQRQAALHEALRELSEAQDDPDVLDARAARDAAFTARALELGVDVIDHGGAAPYCITGIVAGRAFMFRERHDAWRVEIATDDAPTGAFWDDRAASSLVIARDESGLYDTESFEITALETAVAAVTTYLLRRTCTHPGAVTYCPVCGLERAHFDTWQTGCWKP